MIEPHTDQRTRRRIRLTVALCVLAVVGIYVTFFLEQM